MHRPGIEPGVTLLQPLIKVIGAPQALPSIGAPQARPSIGALQARPSIGFGSDPRIKYIIVLQPRLREGLMYHPCTASCLPLNAMYIRRILELQHHIMMI